MTSDYAHADLCFLTIPSRGCYLLNITLKDFQVFDETGFARIQISTDQLAGIVVAGVRALLSQPTEVGR